MAPVASPPESAASAVEGGGTVPATSSAPASAGPTSGDFPRAAAGPAPLTLTYLGVAGWTVSDDHHAVAIDPYLSRPRLAPGVPIVPDEAAIAARIPAKLDLIVIGHSHVDHVLDAPAVARRTGASVMGSLSTANYARAAGLPAEKVIPIKGGEDYAFDGFSVRVLPGLHSALDDKHTMGAHEIIPASGRPPTTMAQFAEGGTFNYLLRMGGRQLLVIGSANYIEREMEGLRPDIAIVAVGLRQEIYDYTCRLMRALGNPPLVLTNHFDAWTKPATEPLDPDTLADLEAFTAEVHACAPDTRVVVPRPFQPIRL